MSSDQVRFVRIRNNKRGSRIAFVEFWDLYDATEFHDRFYPDISFPLVKSRGVDSEPVTVGIDYSRPREDMDRHDYRSDEGGWKCFDCGGLNYPHRAACYKCKVERPDDWATAGGYNGLEEGAILTGETDECPQQMPSQFVVIRDLEASVTEEVLAKGIMKLFVDSEPQQQARDPRPTANKLKSTAPTNSTAGLGASPGSLRRVFLIRDRRSNESWRYGFAEFATIEDAKGALAKFRASAKFTIASKPVTVAFIHTGVFVPSFDPPSPELERVTFAPIYNPSVRVKYWEDRAYPSTFIVTSTPEPSDLAGQEPGQAADKNAASSSDKGGPASQDASAKKTKKEKDAAASKKALAMAPQMQMWAKKAAELHGTSRQDQAGAVPDDRPAGVDADAPAVRHQGVPSKAAPPDAPGSTSPVAPHRSDQYVSYADWDGLECLLCGKFKSQEWLIYHEVHTHGSFKDEGLKAQAEALLAARAKKPRTIVRRVPRKKSDALPIYTSYADQDNLVCYVCRRKFTSLRVLRVHERESELHRRNLTALGRVEAATAELASIGWKPAKMLPLGYDGPARTQQKQYRDRALERRVVYSQPSRPSGRPAAAAAEKRAGEPPEQQQQQQPQQPQPQKSKGAGLLAKMGWAAGEGLGAEGSGRTETLATELYAPGVGLGAEGGRLGDAGEEAARKTRGDFTDFVEKTRDKARERFERLA